MSKGLAAGAVVLVSLPVLAIGGAMIAMAEEESTSSAAAGGLNAAALPEAARPFVPWIVRSAGQCDQLTPAVIAAQLWAESGFNPDAEGPETGSGAALGIAQFLPSTYATYGEDSDGDGQTGPTDPEDAIMAQGKFMCSLLARAESSGYPGGTVELALAGYNAGWGAVSKYRGIPPYRETSEYVAKIMAKAKEWSATVVGEGAGADAVRRAAKYLGTPYVWGGGTPAGPSTGFCDGTNGYLNGECFAAHHEGFDCSSLTQFAWWPSLELPRVAADQYHATAGHKVDRDDLQTGDLLFWRSGSKGIYHVALYYNDGKILHTPRTGEKVEIVPISEAMPPEDYYAATRPGASS